MINVNDKLKSFRTGVNGRKGKARAEGTAAVGRSFTDHLVQQVEEVAKPSLNQQLDHLRLALDDAGANLERNPSLGNLEVFKALLSNLVSTATQGAYQVEGIGAGWSAAEKHHVVKLIDQEAEELLQLVLSEQKDKIKIATKLVHIKGLVVDLLS